MKRPLRGWRLILFARCEHASHADSDAWDGPVEADRRWAARLHRIACGPCRCDHRQMKLLRRLLASAPDFFKRRHTESTNVCLSVESACRMRDALRDAYDEERDEDHF